MKLYFAGAESQTYFDLLMLQGVKNVLMSYWMIKFPDRYLSLVKNDQVDVFMDCGAYSAWSHGFTIDVNDYANFLKAVKHRVTTYPNLDVKGSIEQTTANMVALETAGLEPIPVYHLNTDNWSLLQEYIAKYKYIAVGAIAGEKKDKSILYKRLDTLFALAKKNPVTRFHAFGVTVKDIFYRYPFYSADSTSWLAVVKYGSVTTKQKVELMHSRNRNKIKQLTYSINHYKKMEKEVTKLWTERGITWE